MPWGSELLIFTQAAACNINVTGGYNLSSSAFHTLLPFVMWDFFHFFSPWLWHGHLWMFLVAISHLLMSSSVLLVLPQGHCQCLFVVLLAQHAMFTVKVSSNQSKRPFEESLLMLTIATSNQQWRVAPNWFGKWIWQHCYTPKAGMM